MKHIQFRLRFFLATLVLIMVVGTFGFMRTEGLSPIDAFYFNIVTITTVGYGDIHPITVPGKMLAVLLIHGSEHDFCTGYWHEDTRQCTPFFSR